MAPPDTSQSHTIADLFLQRLTENSVDYIFAVLGSDHASLIEAHTHRQRTHQPTPQILHFQHEHTALSAASAYARLVSKPQVVLVHTDVGTLALAQALANKPLPVLIFAGLAPLTQHGELQGSRSEHVQWYQDVPDQGRIVAPYMRYQNEIRVAEQVRGMVARALGMVPAYLTASREILARDVDQEVWEAGSSSAKKTDVKLGGLPPEAVSTISDALLWAEKPLVITGYLGRNHAAVRQLIRLTDTILGLRVLDSEMREMSFPADHSAWLSRSTGAAQAIRTADVILVLDCDVPWIPTKVHPAPKARIFHIDIDAHKGKMQLFDIGAEASFQAECEIALDQLCSYTTKACRRLAERQELFEERWTELIEQHTQGMETLRLQALTKGSAAELFATMRRVLPADTTFAHDAVTNTIPLFEHLQFTRSGSSLSKGGSGLGWAGGAAIGVKLALDKYDISDRPHIKPRSLNSPAGLVCSITGDGSFIFGVPSAVYWAQHRLKTPFLTIVVNNGGWKATRLCIDDVHPEGVAAGVSDEDLGIDLAADSPDYIGIAIAASNGTLWGKKVSFGVGLADAIKEAVDVVQQEKRGALLEVVIRD